MGEIIRSWPAEGGFTVSEYWTEEQVAEFRRRFAQVATTRTLTPMKYQVRRGRVRLVPALSRRTRLRLRVTGRIDHLGASLVEHGHFATARRVWRVCGMWLR